MDLENKLETEYGRGGDSSGGERETKQVQVNTSGLKITLKSPNSPIHPKFAVLEKSDGTAENEQNVKLTISGDVTIDFDIS